MVFVLVTMLAFRTYILMVPTVVTLVDMTLFFDTIRVEPLITAMMGENINYLVIQFMAKMYRSICAKVRTATEESTLWKMYPGLRQGGRFSTTGAKV